ncbi:MAG: AAA family ATPase [Verrucomicrobia bacterium]|nr:AAA family ATPase [Verrucomicrobiota bacterium]
MDKIDQEMTKEERAAVDQLANAQSTVVAELRKVIVGMEPVIEEVMIAIFARGHALLVGVPGLAKTLLISTLAQSLSLSFKRIQFTPDLMPSDITGTEVIQENKSTGERVFRYLQGPIFANVILADEINRTPPKTQAALLEAMQERQVTVAGNRHKLPEPFFVLATQNPIEQEGTYPLPEAQLDRFMFMINVGYPKRSEEMEILEKTTTTYVPDVKTVLSGEKILKLQDLVRKVRIDKKIHDYILDLVRATRCGEPEAPDFVNQWVGWGAGPRACQYLVMGAKAKAILDGRAAVERSDVDRVAHPVLRHRVITNFNAEAEGMNPDKLIDRLIKHCSGNAA